MGTTLLTHNCGHPVVIDATGFLKVISPSFNLSPTGVSNLILDIFVENDSKITPSYLCTSCEKALTSDQLKDDVMAVCQVCGKPGAVDTMNVHSHIAVVCNTCMAAMRGDSDLTSQQLRYKGGFGITRTTRVTPLVKVLMSIKLK
jgi:hypothetical protein